MPEIRNKYMLKTCAMLITLALAACGGGGGGSDAAISAPASTSPTAAPTPTSVPTPTPTPSVADNTTLWPTSAQNDAAVQGKKPAYPTTLCASIPATLTTNAKNLLDDSVDAGGTNSQPDASRIQAAITACPSGQAVKLVAGSAGQNAFLSGPLTLPAGVSLWVDNGVTLFASRKPSDYQISGKNTCGQTASSDNGCQALINAVAGNNGLYGQGTIDGRGGAVLTSGIYANTLTWWDVGALTKTMSSANQNSPRLLQVTGGSNFSLYQVSLQNAPKFHVVASGVNGFTAWGNKLQSPTLAYSVAGYQCASGTTPTVSGSANITRASTCFTPDTVKNTDGIDPGQTQNVLIAFNHISTGDDGIAIKAHTTGPASGIQILHNRFYYTHGMSIGSETDSGVNNVTISDMVVDGYDAGATSGFRIKTDDSRGGEVKNVTVDGLCVRRVQQPLLIDTYYGNASGSSNQLYPNVHDITIRNVRYLNTTGSVYNGASAAIGVRGYQSQGQTLPAYNITLDNVVFDSTPSWVSTGMAYAIPSYGTISMGAGPVSFASLLTSASGNNAFTVTDNRSASAAAYDCSAAFVSFPSGKSPI
ncbi:polygalacturonase [Silvimonas terrae]|uniref:Polygalacturonase n=1 Tax=Silvimonas terrae TaxID=300266 RepID=A0A840RBF8_9NEIS|nr:glycosyl hydrolase family 28 protein [Silvimonas terrae]MBB5189914.1 polygalacturonase [Silvimonas terrae]